MLDGWMDGELVGSGAAIWKAAANWRPAIDNGEFLQIAAASALRPATATPWARPRP
jgi:dihydroxy-acid dehydratase